MKSLGLALTLMIGFGCTTSNKLTAHDSPEHTRQLVTQPSSPRAKNVILFIGDGMGLSTVTAARIYAGQQQGGPGEDHVLSFERFPNTAFSKVYNTNQQVPDSAGTATAMLSGQKTLSGVIGVNDKVVKGVCASMQGNTLPTIAEQAEERGLATGVVSTARITHATPAAAFAHSVDRNWESNGMIPVEQSACTDIAVQLVEFSHGDGIEIVLGGGLALFVSQSDGGARTDGRNLIDEWRTKHRDNGIFVTSHNELNQAIQSAPDNKNILGLFNPTHMAFEVDRQRQPSEEPSLSDMTTAAISHLSKNAQGYFLLIEAGRIDHAHHAGNAARALEEAVELSRAVDAAVNMTDQSDTLIVVTADHGHTLNIGGYPTRGNPILGYVIENDLSGAPKNTPALDKDQHPYTTLSYANGPGADPIQRTTEDPENLDYLQIAAVTTTAETHSGTDVPVYASGPGADKFRGVIEQNLIYDYIVNALGLVRNTDN